MVLCDMRKRVSMYMKMSVCCTLVHCWVSGAFPLFLCAWLVDACHLLWWCVFVGWGVV